LSAGDVTTPSARQGLLKDKIAPPMRLSRRLFGPPALGAAAVGLVFFTESLRPTLLPRPLPAQSVISALCVTIGYGLGGVIVAFVGFLSRKVISWRPSASLRRTGKIALAIGWALAITIGMWYWIAQQNQQRHLTGVSSISWTSTIVVVVLTTVIAAIFMLIGRLVAAGVGWVDRSLQRLIPKVAAVSIVVVLVSALCVGLFNRVVVNGALDSIDTAFSAGDSGTEAGVVQPTNFEQSGSPSSLAAWDTLGRQGRTWVAGATSVDALRAYCGDSASVEPPIRVYAGLQSASSDDARAQLVLKELIRTGAFQRKVLVVATATGSGWINPVMSSALEYMWCGDTAMASMQYSYLPSWVAFITDTAKAQQAGEALNHVVTDYWRTLPIGSRPMLVTFGESLGSYGAEFAWHGSNAQSSATATVADGRFGLYVGPTNANPSWGQYESVRSPSPVWRPVVTFPGADAPSVVFATSAEELAQIAPRSQVVYEQHASDPVTWWSVPTLWAEPAWVSATPRGSDLPSGIGWFPIVTFVQTTGDLIQGFSAAAGHGHNYNNAWAQALATIVPPSGWTAADTSRLAAEMVALHGLGAN
jgi:uncharacterized membrane protein